MLSFIENCQAHRDDYSTLTVWSGQYLGVVLTVTLSLSDWLASEAADPVAEDIYYDR